MKKLNNKNLETIVGGEATISGTIINAFTNIIKAITEIGEGIGSGIRRVKEHKLCPLE